MKLLLDENLSHLLVHSLGKKLGCEITHVRNCNLKGSPDYKIWDFAHDNGYTILSKDSDFYQRSILHGHPPKVVWIKIGNCSIQDLETLLITEKQKIIEFIVEKDQSVLIIA